MIDIQESRKKIDEIDKKLIALFEERMDITYDIATFKYNTGKPVFDKEREEQKIESVKKQVSNEEYSEYAAKFMQYMMELSKENQKKIIDGK